MSLENTTILEGKVKKEEGELWIYYIDNDRGIIPPYPITGKYLFFS